MTPKNRPGWPIGSNLPDAELAALQFTAALSSQPSTATEALAAAILDQFGHVKLERFADILSAFAEAARAKNVHYQGAGQ
jgi:hypothetical protein